MIGEAVSPWPRRIDLPDEAATLILAQDIAACLAPSDVVTLSGGLGAGKTTLARAVLRSLADDLLLEVPSPTFTLVQTYPGRVPVSHFDLFRLATPQELEEIGFDEALSDGAALIEWPERAGDMLPGNRLDIALVISGTGRRAILSGPPVWRGRIERSLAARAFLEEAAWQSAARSHLQGDASTRSYERVSQPSRLAVLMNAPPRTDMAAIAGGLPYSRLVHLAEDVRPFVALDAALLAAGFSAPKLYAADETAGFLLLEDLGSSPVAENGRPIGERYRVAVDLLSEMHSRPRAADLPLPGGGYHRLAAFDRRVMAIELRLLPDWYAEHATGARLPPIAEREFENLWAPLFDSLEQAETSWMLRDFHSPNLLWLAEREGVGRIGLLDFQDALIGPCAYDLASLLEDARVTVPAELETELLAHYCRRRAASGAFDAAKFRQAYAILCAQRATRILGVFARLNKRDGKPSYLRHIPRVAQYLRRTFNEPILSPLARWYENYLPLPTDRGSEP